MPSNIEIKARVDDLERLRKSAESLSRSSGEILEQEDTFFKVPAGRLKLRQLAPNHGELIFYERPDATGPKPSHYLISTTSDPASLRTVLATALGVIGMVRKERHLFLVEQTRVHLDKVRGLGTFLELEVMLSKETTIEQGTQLARDLMKRLGINEVDLVQGAYLDLLLKDGGSPASMLSSYS